MTNPACINEYVIYGDGIVVGDDKCTVLLKTGPLDLISHEPNNETMLTTIN